MAPWLLLAAAGPDQSAPPIAPFTDDSQINPRQALDCTQAPTPGRRAEACGEILKSPHLQPKAEALAHYWRGQALLVLRDQKTATEDFDAAVKLDPTLIAARWMRAVMFFDRGDFSNARADLDEVVRAAPKAQFAWGLRAETLTHVGRFADADSDYTQAIALGGEAKVLAALFAGRGQVRGMEHRTDQALADYSEAIRLLPDDPRLYLSQGDLYEADHQYAKAVDDFSAVIRLFPQKAYAYGRRGVLRDDLGQHDDAIPDFTRAIELASPPELAQRYLDRGISYEAGGHFDKALADLDESINRQRQRDALVARGRVKFFMKDMPGAIADLKQAADDQPRDQYAPLWLFLAQNAAGQDARAELARRAPQIDVTRWPGPLVEVFLGTRPADRIELPPHDTDWERARDKCELEYYRGELALTHGDRTDAAKAFQAAIATGTTEYVEYHAAQIELKQLAP